jgi:hypothetical protein
VAWPGKLMDSPSLLPRLGRVIINMVLSNLTTDIRRPTKVITKVRMAGPLTASPVLHPLTPPAITLRREPQSHIGQARARRILPTAMITEVRREKANLRHNSDGPKIN